MFTPIARLVTRPSGKLENMTKFNPSEPDLIMATLLRSGKHLLKSNCVYELVYNELSDTIELKEVGEANIGKKWGMNFYDIPIHHGNKVFLTKEEQTNLSYNKDL